MKLYKYLSKIIKAENEITCKGSHKKKYQHIPNLTLKEEQRLRNIKNEKNEIILSYLYYTFDGNICLLASSEPTRLDFCIKYLDKIENHCYISFHIKKQEFEIKSRNKEFIINNILPKLKERLYLDL